MIFKEHLAFDESSEFLERFVPGKVVGKHLKQQANFKANLLTTVRIQAKFMAYTGHKMREAVLANTFCLRKVLPVLYNHSREVRHIWRFNYMAKVQLVLNAVRNYERELVMVQ